MKTRSTLLTLVCVLVASLPLAAQYFTAPFGKDGTWNLYQEVTAASSWIDAHKAAGMMKDPLGGSDKMGHLVTVSSIEENMFLRLNLTSNSERWLGLTDNEVIKGARETEGRRKGWAWVTGEPVTFAHWKPSEPNEGGTGEDAVTIGWVGQWNDLPCGVGGQDSPVHGYIIEWDVEAEQPIKGANVPTPVFPKELPPMPALAKPAGGGAHPWLASIYRLPAAKSLREHARGIGKNSISVPFANHIYGSNRNGAGWFPIDQKLPPPATLGPFGARFQATLKIEKAGPYSIGIHADDHFACRIGEHKWISAGGWGGIDPLDRTTLYQDLDHADGFALGVIELPVGEHLIDVVLSNSGREGLVQVFGAPGAFLYAGATDQWRLLGHHPQEEVAWPGIDDKGWTVSYTEGVPAKNWENRNLQDALLYLTTSPKVKEANRVKQLCYVDPDTPGANRFTNPVPFPGDKPDNSDRFVLQAKGTLVIPADGVYHIGFHTDLVGAIRIKEQKWLRKARDSSQRARINGDTLYRDMGWILLDSQVIGEIALKKGTYDIEVIFPRNKPIAFLEVFGSPAGYPPRLLRVGGAEITKDHPGIPVVAHALKNQKP